MSRVYDVHDLDVRTTFKISMRIYLRKENSCASSYTLSGVGNGPYTLPNSS